jgi:sentrin-specific protease 1
VQLCHWVLAIVDLKDKELMYLDSMRNFGNLEGGCLEALGDYVVAEAWDKKQETMGTSEWKRSSPTDMPQQENNSDCGVFMLTAADCISRDTHMTFSQAQMPDFRRRILAEVRVSHLIDVLKTQQGYTRSAISALTCWL